MPIQFIPNDDKGALGSVGEFLALMQRNQFAQLQGRSLDLEEQKIGIEKATQALVQQRAQMEIDDKKSLDSAIAEHVDEAMPGVNPGYRYLAKNGLGLTMAQHLSQTAVQTQGMESENSLRALQQEQLRAQQPFFALNAANASAIGTTQRQSAEENLSLQRAMSDSQIASAKGAAAMAWKGAPLSLRQKMAQENPELAKYLDTTTLSDDDMMSHIMTEAPDQAPIFFAMRTLGPQGFVPIMNPDGTMTTPAEVLASKLGPLFKDLNQRYGSSKGKSPTTQPTAKQEKDQQIEKATQIGQSAQAMRDEAKTIEQHVGYFKEFQRQMRPKRDSEGIAYYTPAIDYADKWGEPPEHFKGKGHGQYSKVELDKIFSVAKTPDASDMQAASVNFLLDKMIQADNPKAVYQAWLQAGDAALTGQQRDLMSKLSKTYKWGLE